MNDDRIQKLVDEAFPEGDARAPVSEMWRNIQPRLPEPKGIARLPVAGACGAIADDPGQCSGAAPERPPVEIMPVLPDTGENADAIVLCVT